MNRLITCICAAVMIVCFTSAALTESAGTDGVLTGLWNCGNEFLFHTNNVTVTGEAVFSLDGEQFKTAKLHYIQDGYSSFYGLTLLTPRSDGNELETGWTIIADENNGRYVMEKYNPGFFRLGTGRNENTLLHRTVRLDALTNLGGLLIGQVEDMIPAQAVTAVVSDNMRTVHISVREDQIPDIAVSALNLAAGYLSDRWFALGYDRSTREDEGHPFDHYITVTGALTDGTECWILRGADMEFSMDPQNRLTAAKGTLRAASVFWDQSVREVEMRFDLVMSDYGSSHVKPFDPADYNVVLAQEEDGSFKTITAMATELDPDHIELSSCYARLHSYKPDTNRIDVELITPEVFRKDEVESLKVGDSIYTGGREVFIFSITEEFGYLVLNEGEYEFSEGSVWLTEDEDGNYRPVIYDDSVWTVVARIELPVTDRLLFLDMIDPKTGEPVKKPTVHSAAEFTQYFSKDGDPGFAANNTLIAFDQEGSIAVIERYYVPWQ